MIDVPALLQDIEPTRAPGLVLFPCEATLRSGTDVSRLIVMDISFYREYGLPAPAETIAFREVESVRVSPRRIPASIAQSIYNAEETSMGGFSIKLVFTGKRSLDYAAGGIIDFPALPVGYSMSELLSATTYPPGPKAIGSASFEVSHI